MSSDAKPVSGETLDAGSMMTIAKVTQHMRSVKFLAVESATERRLLINGMDSVNVSPSKKQIVTPLIISGAYNGRKANRLPSLPIPEFFVFYLWGVETGCEDITEILHPIALVSALFGRPQKRIKRQNAQACKLLLRFCMFRMKGR